MFSRPFYGLLNRSDNDSLSLLICYLIIAIRSYRREAITLNDRSIMYIILLVISKGGNSREVTMTLEKNNDVKRVIDGVCCALCRSRGAWKRSNSVSLLLLLATGEKQ